MFTQFPQIPNFKGEWRAIQLEPIIGSGERITVAISVLGHSSRAFRMFIWQQIQRYDEAD